MLPPKLSWTTFCHDSPWRETPWRSTGIDSRSASPGTGSRMRCTSRTGGCSSIRNSWSTRQGRLATEKTKVTTVTTTVDTKTNRIPNQNKNDNDVIDSKFGDLLQGQGTFRRKCWFPESAKWKSGTWSRKQIKLPIKEVTIQYSVLCCESLLKLRVWSWWLALTNFLSRLYHEDWVRGHDGAVDRRL